MCLLFLIGLLVHKKKEPAFIVEAVAHLVLGHEVLVDSGEPGVFGGVPLVQHSVLAVTVQLHSGFWVLEVLAWKGKSLCLYQAF